MFKRMFRPIRCMVLVAVAIVITAFMTVGCSTAPSSSQQVATTLAIKYATLRVIEKAPDRTEAAERIIAVTMQAEQLVDTGTISHVNELAERIRERINWLEMDASRSLLTDALLTAVKLELENRINGGVLNPRTIVVMKHVMQDIVLAARLYT